MKYCVMVLIVLVTVCTVAMLEREQGHATTLTVTEKELDREFQYSNQKIEAKQAVADSYILGLLSLSESVERFSQIDGFPSATNKSLVVEIAVFRIRYHDGIDRAVVLARIEKDSE